MAKRTITIEVEDDEVVVALKRPEDGYEDVHPDLVAEDAIMPNWPEYRTIWPKEQTMAEPTDEEQYLNIADQCAATATSDLAASILVDGGNGTLRQLLNDAADALRAGWATPQPTQAQAGAVPPEAEPIVLNCEAPGDLKPGDYVFASRWSDCDPGDPWEVGFVSEVGVYPESMTKAGYVVLQGGSRRWGRAMRITPEQGRRICEQFPSMERLPQDYDAIARVFGIKGGQHGAEH